ncbi:MAG: FAD-dependent oxidoreductase [Natrialbaceae archaeon]|nr:FAD-dependent oxidoreductase [Natrialbaceae archaeon]
MLLEYTLGRALESAGVDGSLVLWALRYLATGRSDAPICSFDGGLGELSTALYEAHSASISLETPVTGMERHPDGYALHTPADTVVVDDVVLTTPAPTAASLLESIDQDSADRLSQLRYNPIALVYLESSFDDPGIGTLVPDGEPVPISGTTWNARILDRDSLFTCYLDPGSYPGLADAADSELESAATEAFETLTGAPASPIHVHRWQPGMPAYDGSWRALDELALPDGIHLCTNFVARPGILGRIRHAGQIAATIEANR